MRPYDAKTFDQVCNLRMDNFISGDYWILTDGGFVFVKEQKTGEKSKQQIIIPRATFNRMIDWYMRDQKAK